ncbi:hypothetical protein BGX26_006867 [Mortierella sp. AD094]|nr:hypothetical protein BGX26_006867 [Mortierella sp. AD094]
MGIDVSPESHLLPCGKSEKIVVPTQEEMQQACIQQLGRLCRLTSLIMADRSYWADPRRGISFKLSQGLDQLAGLKDLEELSFARAEGGEDGVIGEEEVEWMADHWRRLRKVRYRFALMEMPRDRTSWWREWKVQFLEEKNEDFGAISMMNRNK